MRRIGKKPAQTQFTSREWDLIDEITITLADVVGRNSRIDYESPQKLKMAYLQMTSTRKQIDRLSLIEMSGKEGMFHEQIQKNLTEISKGLLKYAKELRSNRSRLSKLLKEFEEKHIFIGISGKKNIKKQSPKSIPRQLKGGEPKREGYLKVYKLTSTVEDYIKILSDSQALDIINKRLVKHGSLKKAYDLIFKNAVDLFKNIDERFFDFLLMFKILIPNLDPTTIPDPKLAKEAIRSAGKEELEQRRKEVVQRLLENPSANVFFIFSLTHLDDNG
jgi:hypothetical protein